MDEEPVRIFIHPMLAEELQYLKDELENKLNYKIRGGIPIVSKVLAQKLRMKREKKGGSLIISSKKVIGEKKVELCF